MVKSIKNMARKFLFAAGIDITKNQQYDRLTLTIMKKVLKKDSCCIDVGCHKGEVMDEMIRISPGGKHVGFEPIPEYFGFLKKKYERNPDIMIIQQALSDVKGEVEFNWVKNAPAYSGLQEREYALKNPEIEKIKVQTIPLDELGANFPKTDLIKIDVEGAEMKVLNGARQFLQKHQPWVIFECGKGAADYYGTTPEMVFDYFRTLKYSLYNLKDFVDNKPALTKESFTDTFESKREYYFVASPHS